MNCVLSCLHLVCYNNEDIKAIIVSSTFEIYISIVYVHTLWLFKLFIKTYQNVCLSVCV